MRSMKTTLDLDDELLVRAKALAAREGRSLTGLIEDGLRLRLRVATPGGRESGRAGDRRVRRHAAGWCPAWIRSQIGPWKHAADDDA